MKKIGETDEEFRERQRAIWTPERREKMRQKRLGAANPTFGSKHTDEWKQAARERMSGSNNPFAGKNHPPDVQKKICEGISKALKGRAPRLYRYGITDEEYSRQLAAGNVWCCGAGKHFVSKDKIKEHGSSGGLCVDCAKSYRRVRKLDNDFGVTPEWFETKLKEQGGTCALCHKTFDTENGEIRNLCVDHDHVTNEPRGILCRRCNSSLERAEKIPGWIVKALEYLKQYGSKVAA